MVQTEFPIRPQMLGASSVIAAKIAASAVTRAKLQYSALQLHIRTSRTVRSVGGSTGDYTVNVGFSCRDFWGRISSNGGGPRVLVPISINSSKVRMVAISKCGAVASMIVAVTGASAAIYWCALR